MTTQPTPENFAHPNAAPIAEAELARAAGLQREDLKKLRAQMVEGEDWIGGNGRPVLITASGKAKLAALLADQDGAKKSAAGLEGLSANEGQGGALGRALEAAGTGAMYVALIVHQRTLNIKNARLVLATAEAGDAPETLVRVDVKNAALFRPGMRLERCMPSKDYPGFFYYHGRMPRRPGKF